LSDWLEASAGRLYWDECDAQEAASLADDGSVLYKLPDQLGAEYLDQGADTNQVHGWAHRLSVTARECWKVHARFSLFPAPPKRVINQRQEGFDVLLHRFYSRGLLPLAQQASLARTAVQLQELPPLGVQWAGLIKRHAVNAQDEMNTWRLLWVTAGEMLEWYLSRASTLFQHQLEWTENEAALRGRCTDDQRNTIAERFYLADLLHAWLIVSCASPVECRPSKKGLEELEMYVLVRLAGRLRYVQARYRGEEPPCEALPIVPESPDLALLLRYPQLDRLPPGWSWRRQVRTRRGIHFGSQDILFYPTWEENFANQRRCRTYADIEKLLQVKPAWD
jgi:hypothetical protein